MVRMPQQAEIKRKHTSHSHTQGSLETTSSSVRSKQRNKQCKGVVLKNANRKTFRLQPSFQYSSFGHTCLHLVSNEAVLFK